MHSAVGHVELSFWTALGTALSHSEHPFKPKAIQTNVDARPTARKKKNIYIYIFILLNCRIIEILICLARS